MKKFKKEPGSKEHAGEVDFNSLEENLGDEAYNYLLAKSGEQEANRIKTRIEKLIYPNKK